MPARWPDLHSAALLPALCGRAGASVSDADARVPLTHRGPRCWVGEPWTLWPSASPRWPATACHPTTTASQHTSPDGSTPTRAARSPAPRRVGATLSDLLTPADGFPRCSQSGVRGHGGQRHFVRRARWVPTGVGSIAPCAHATDPPRCWCPTSRRWALFPRSPRCWPTPWVAARRCCRRPRTPGSPTHLVRRALSTSHAAAALLRRRLPPSPRAASLGRQHPACRRRGPRPSVDAPRPSAAAARRPAHHTSVTRATHQLTMAPRMRTMTSGSSLSSLSTHRAWRCLAERTYPTL